MCVLGEGEGGGADVCAGRGGGRGGGCVCWARGREGGRMCMQVCAHINIVVILPATATL